MLCVGSFVFFVVGISMVAGHDSDGYAVGALFGLFFLFELVNTVRPAKLTMNDQDFKLDWLIRHSTYEFNHCGEFQVMSIPVGLGRTKLIAFQYDGPGKPLLLSRKIGADGTRRVSIPSNFRMHATKVVELLNARRTAIQPLSPT
jgi:hypothetical protein